MSAKKSSPEPKVKTAKTPNPVREIQALAPKVENLQRVLAALETRKVTTADGLLTAAKEVSDAAIDLQPLITSLVRKAREPGDGKPASWGEVAKHMELASAQRAFDRYDSESETRKAATRERVSALRSPHQTLAAAQLPGLSALETAKALGIDRLTVKAWAEASPPKLDSMQPKNAKGEPLTVRRGPKGSPEARQVPVVRYFPVGTSLADTAAELGVAPSKVEAIAAEGRLPRAPMVDAEHQQLDDAAGRPRWWYFPQSLQPEA